MSEKFKHTYRGYLVDNHCPKPPVVTLENLDPAEWEKFIVESGIFSKKEEEIRLYRIMDLTLERSFVQRLFGLGTITCDTVDKSTPKLCIKNVKDSRRVKELISEAVEKERVKKRVSSREYMTVDDDCDCDCDCDHDHEED